MGAIAEGIVAYAQPLLDQTDGSVEQLNKAMTISQLCWNLALLSEEGRDRMLSEIRPSLDMDEEQFGEFRRSIIDPMIRRHREMFPLMHRLARLLPGQATPRRRCIRERRPAKPILEPSLTHCVPVRAAESTSFVAEGKATDSRRIVVCSGPPLSTGVANARSRASSRECPWSRSDRAAC